MPFTCSTLDALNKRNCVTRGTGDLNWDSLAVRILYKYIGDMLKFGPFSTNTKARSAGLGTSWWWHRMETISALPALCEVKPPNQSTEGFPLTKASYAEFRCFLKVYMQRDKRLDKQSRRRWFETPRRPLWCHCNMVCGVAIGWLIWSVVYRHKM